MVRAGTNIALRSMEGERSSVRMDCETGVYILVDHQGGPGMFMLTRSPPFVPSLATRKQFPVTSPSLFVLIGA